MPAYIRKCNFHGKVKKKIVVGSLIVTSFQKHCCRLAKAIELYFVPVKHNKCLLPIDGDSIFSYFDAFSPMMPSQQAWYNVLKLILKEHAHFFIDKCIFTKKVNIFREAHIDLFWLYLRWLNLRKFFLFWAVSAKLRQPTGQTQDNFNFGPSLLKF